MSKGIQTSTLSEYIQALLRSSGYSQKQLAEALGLHPKVVSRKLNGSGNAHFTHMEVRTILLTLTRWHVITTQDEAFGLLALAQVGPSLFDGEEWLSPPLNQLQPQTATPASLDAANVPLLPTFQHTLPAPTTRLVGREWMVERLRQLLGQNDIRLVTLLGTGGSGKTRIALYVAHQFIHMFGQGIYFVPLAGISDPTLVPMSIIQSLNLKPSSGVSLVQSLCTYLRNKNLLLILDNFEHVSAAADVINEMLVACPGLKVMVTSRSLLRLHGEHILTIPPLDMPATNVDMEVADLMHYEAIGLFVERAQAVMPSFALTNENKESIIQICAKVDGLPLALELAAARIRVLSPALLLKRLSNARLAILTGGARNLPGRQQTLRNTIAWSYDLLSSHGQEWFPCLAIFSESWSLEAVEAMMQQETTAHTLLVDASAALDMIQQLVDASLLVQSSSSTEYVRFTMLETLREYAWELLQTREELEQWRDWHACYFLQIVEDAEQGLRGPQQLLWLERLTLERDNIRVALEWLLQRARAGMRIQVPPSFRQATAEVYREVAGSSTLARHTVPGTGRYALEVYLRLAAALRPYWEWQGYLTEGRNWLSAVTSLPLAQECGETLRAARAKALSELARLTSLQDEQTLAGALVEESHALWRELDDTSGLATALLHRGWIALATSDYEMAKRAYQEGLQVLEGTNELWIRAQLLCCLAPAYGFQFDFEPTRFFYRRSRELFEELDDKTSVADVLKDSGGMLILEGDYTEAITSLLKSISLCYEIGHKQFVAIGMGWLAFAIGLRGKPDERTATLHTAQLQGATQSLMDIIGMTHWARANPFIQGVQMQLRFRVDDESWDEAWNAGRKLTPEGAIELAFRLGKL